MTDAGQPDDWKQKYFLALEREEALEQGFRATEELLHRIVSRLAIAAAGRHPDIDDAVRTLRERLREGCDAGCLAPLADALTRAIAAMEEPDDGPVIPPSLTDALDAAPVPGPLRDKLDGIKARLVSARRHQDVIDALDEAARLLGQALDRQSEPKALTGALSELLDHLVLPARLQPDLDRIRRALDTPGRPPRHVFRDIAALVGRMRHDLQKELNELESFLKQVAGQLHAIETRIGRAESLRSESLEDSRRIHALVRGQVDDIRSGVEDAADIDDLKRDIRQQLQNIDRHMSRFTEQQENREHEARAQVEALTRQLRAMETEAERLRESVHREHGQAIRDGLTGLFNRLGYAERMEQEYARWRRYRSPLSLVVVDVDHFKRINDRFGHQAGDRALKRIAAVMKKQLRDTDFLARFGGEEFVVVMPGTDSAQALGVADKLRQAVEASPFHHAGSPVPVTISAGVAGFAGDDTPDTVFARADRATYLAKQRGRNRCCAGQDDAHAA